MRVHMTAVKDLTQVKMEHADELKQQIMQLCLRHCAASDDRTLLRIGSYLGDFTNNLRSALNYTMGKMIELKLKPALLPSDYRKVKRDHDFPWANDRTRFDNITIVTHFRSHYPQLYAFLESAQPYHQSKEWLRYLMRISNRDKHEIINEVSSPDIVDVVAVGSDGTTHAKPEFFGDYLLVVAAKKPHLHPLPFYYRPYGAFATNSGKWSIYYVLLDQSKIGLIQFTERTLVNVEQVIKDIAALM